MGPLTGSVIAAEVEEADRRLKLLRNQHENAVLVTPMLRSRTWLEHAHYQPSFSRQVYIKLESEQVTGSFKVRGALNCVSAALERGQETLVTASTGNHGLGTAHALELLGGKGVIFVPADAKRVKIDALRAYTANGKIELRTVDGDCLAAEQTAQKYANEAQNGEVLFVSPYNDRDVVAGQGTIGAEIERALSRIAGIGAARSNVPHCLYVTVGGGGLIAGIAAYLKHRSKVQWRVVGAQPRRSAVMAACVKEGKVVKDVVCEDTLSDGSAGLIEEEAMTLAPCTELVDEWILVDEDEIRRAVRQCFFKEGKVVEGSAGVAMAAFLQDFKWHQDNHQALTVIVACGGNIDPETFVDIAGTRSS